MRTKHWRRYNRETAAGPEMAGAQTEVQLKRYAAAIVPVGCAVLAALAIRPLFDGRVPQTIFTIAVLIAAAYGGLIAGLIATALSAGAIAWLFLDSFFSILPIRPSLILFVVLGVAISAVMEQFRRGRTALERSKNELEKINSELSKRSQALAKSNEELARFAYALSHDLQNPLRTVSLFAEHLARENRPATDEASAQSLRFIMEGVARMQDMIRGLLDYSTVMHEESAREEHSDANAVIGEVLADLRSVIEDSGAQILVGPLPVIGVGAGPLRQLFENILSNAIKYRGERIPEIHVSAQLSGGEWIVSVGDNGIGIDMQYAEKIFGVFERLHAPSQYGGSGIGLAICRAIVQRHGGRIWVDSEPGRGATFFFTVPAEKSGRKMAHSA